MDKINKRRVLIAPLDWGLGHATRCIPIIHALQILNYEVVIASDGAATKLLSEEFPEIRIIPLDGYHIHYASTAKGLFWKLLLQIPKILSSIQQEQSTFSSTFNQLIRKRSIWLFLTTDMGYIPLKSLPYL